MRIGRRDRRQKSSLTSPVSGFRDRHVPLRPLVDRQPIVVLTAPLTTLRAQACPAASARALLSLGGRRGTGRLMPAVCRTGDRSKLARERAFSTDPFSF